jgi:AcrR family transcriptional regulator
MAQLNRDRVAAAALKVLSLRGVPGFTIRAVAEVLGVTPMALYRHVKDKAELASLVVDAANRHHPLPAPSGDWRADLLAMAQWNRMGALTHRGVRELWRAYPVHTPELSSISDRWISLWQQSGLTLKQAVLAAIMSNITINGLISEEEIHNAIDLPEAKALARLPNLRLSLSMKLSRDEMYEFAVKSLIDGMHAHLRRNSKPKKKPAKPRAASKRV